MTPSRKALAALAACLVALAGLTTVADAAKRKPVQQATFKATLSGTQVTTWEYHDPKTDDPCDASADGYGDQTIKFDAGKAFTITFVKPPKRQPDLIGTNGRPGVITQPFPKKFSFEAERNGEYTPHYDHDRNLCQGPNGGGGDASGPAPKDCGVRHGWGSMRLFFHDQLSRSADDDLFVPLGPGFPEKDNLKLATLSDLLWISPRDGSGGSLDGTYENCPFMLGGAHIAREGDVYTSAQKIRERRLFDRRRKRFVISGDRTATHGGGYSSGRTILAWNLRLKRVR